MMHDGFSGFLQQVGSFHSKKVHWFQDQVISRDRLKKVSQENIIKSCYMGNAWVLPSISYSTGKMQQNPSHSENLGNL